MRINQHHTKVYYEFFDLPPDPSVFVACELCGKRANDIHHLDARGMGGRPNIKDFDKIENLMALCSKHHLMYGDIKKHFEFLRGAHMAFIGQFNKRLDYEHEFLPKIKFPLKYK